VADVRGAQALRDFDARLAEQDLMPVAVAPPPPAWLSGQAAGGAPPAPDEAKGGASAAPAEAKEAPLTPTGQMLADIFTDSSLEVAMASSTHLDAPKRPRT
jgi:hypothetical protein